MPKIPLNILSQKYRPVTIKCVCVCVGWGGGGAEGVGWEYFQRGGGGTSKLSEKRRYFPTVGGVLPNWEGYGYFSNGDIQVRGRDN